MLEKDRIYVVMGLLDPDSIAYLIGRTIAASGGKVVYTFQNDLLKKRYFDSSKLISDEEKKAIEYRFCDVTVEDEVKAVFSSVRSVAGVVHSVAYANPKTCLGEEFHTDAIEDIKRSYHVSCLSLATVARHAATVMPGGGSIVTLSFDTKHVYPLYNWMGIHKAALEALVRSLARRHGRDGIRINAVSAGPVKTTASSKIPGFDNLVRMWHDSSPLPWDPVKDKQTVADAVVFLLSPLSRMTSGHVLPVDGGASIIGGELQHYEKPSQAQ